MMTDRSDYGIDAPGIRNAMFAVGASATAIALAARIASARATGPMAASSTALATASAIAATYGVGMGAYMTWSSRIGKVRNRERLLDLAPQDGTWRGDERVLDVGCGRGLMLVGAARRLASGTATGIDIWRPEDQSGNTPGAALANARKAGVADRVVIATGDARDLPFPDARFDVVVSHWVVHNLSTPADRTRALDEMWRVLEPDGTIVLADIEGVERYREHFESLGAIVRFLDGGWEARIMGVLSGGSYRPQALIVRRR